MRRVFQFSLLALAVASVPRPINAMRSAALHTRAQAPPAQGDAAGELSESEKRWRAVVQKNPRDAGALASLGVVLSKEGKYPEAARAYRKALTLDPNLPGIQLNLGLAEF